LNNFLKNPENLPNKFLHFSFPSNRANTQHHTRGFYVRAHQQHDRRHRPSCPPPPIMPAPIMPAPIIPAPTNNITDDTIPAAFIPPPPIMVEEVVYDAAIANDFHEVEQIIDDDDIEDPLANFLNKMPEGYAYDEGAVAAYQAELDEDEASTDEDVRRRDNLIKSEFLIKMKKKTPNFCPRINGTVFFCFDFVIYRN
jgi:hypothetical protein